MSGNDERPSSKNKSIFKDLPVPSKLAEARVWLEYRQRITRNRQVCRVYEHFLEFIRRIERELYTPQPSLIIEDYWNER